MVSAPEVAKESKHQIVEKEHFMKEYVDSFGSMENLLLAFM